MTLPEVIDKHGFTMKAEFIPFSQSRSFKLNFRVFDRNFNWNVTILDRHGREVITIPYSAGLAHGVFQPRCASRITLYEEERIIFETENGKAYVDSGFRSSLGGKKIEPEFAGVFACVLFDINVLDYSCFEDWALDFGYDPDSRKGEANYRICLEMALKVRNSIPHEILMELQEAAREY